MNNWENVRAITRRHFWDDYRSPLTCITIPTSSGSSSGETTDIGINPTYRAAGPTLSVTASPHSAALSWTVVENAYAYVIYRATSPSGPFSILLAGLLAHTFVDAPAVSGNYTYRVTAIEPNYGETEVSNSVSVNV